MPLETPACFVIRPPWRRFWQTSVRLVDEGPLHEDWKRLVVGADHAAYLEEAWFNLKLLAHACRSRHTREWAYSLDLAKPARHRFPTRGLAMRAAEFARRTGRTD